ncbi:YveK family protein [Cohnella thailandensis]|uniref:Lipopolysaccharide biosynthesis protein n=1 Tax=Cohnella thailandensis TaxID=557557 RepID=A0A841SZ74_9BACL|nr:Wzz/FepE/Etk N-terminal domain-containing protein [Cohnella thailandensis]MBB6635130.1 lipopolysaccharide biosynthesis protein [Cohnella thailandensis]MBP1974404.1 capsular polysaccharide biosynthesis protein [Cohnella thailandensis]
MDLKKMAGVIRNRLGMISAIVVVCCLAAGLFTHYMIEPKYEASVKVIVNKTSDAGITLDDVSVNVLLTKTYLELARTGAVMGTVASEHPEYGMDSEELMEMVKFTASENTQVITIAARDSSYEQAATIVNAVAMSLQAKAAEVMKEDNITILEQASLDKRPQPVTPNLILNTVIAFVLSLAVAIAIAFLQEHLDETIRDEETAKDILGIPSLAVVGRIDPVKSRKKTSARKVGDGVYATANQ